MSMASEVSTIALHGRRISYRDSGRGVQPVVFLHGIGSSAAAWEPVALGLQARGHRTIAVDLPGHGSSSKSRGDYSLSELASVQRDLLDALSIPRCLLVGHSLGGGIALQFAYLYRDRLDGLALVSAGGLGPETSTVLKAMAMPGSELVIGAVFNRGTVGAAAALARQWQRFGQVPPVLTPTSIERFREIADPDHRYAFLSILRSVVDNKGQKVSALPHFAALDELPVLLIWGSADHILPVSQGRAAHALLPQSQLVIFEGAGHEPHVEDPARVADLLDHLTSELPRS